MESLQKIWDNFKTQPDVWFFYGFLLTFTLSVRKVLLFYPLGGQFNEYAGIYLYLSDIFLILTILSVLFILYNNNRLLSIFTSPNVPRGTLLIPFLLILWSFLSIGWSSNQNIAIFRSFKLFEFFLLYIYVATQIVPRLPRGLFHACHVGCSTWNIPSGVEQSLRGGTIFRNSVKIIVGVGIIQSILGIWQFIIQHSVGFFWLKESLIAPDLPGIAKVILNGDKFVRSYGFFPHPNILGGFLLVSLMLTLYFDKLFHVEQRRAGVKFILSFIQVLGLILTFSKSAILGLLISLIFISIHTHVPRGTILSKLKNKLLAIFRRSLNAPRKMFHVEHILRSGQSIKLKLADIRMHSQARRIALIVIILLMLLILTKPSINSLIFNSLNERFLYINVSRGTVAAHPFFGLGMGQFVINMQDYARQTLLDWQFQPVHNQFLLIWSELGLVGLGLFVLTLWRLFHVEQSQESMSIKCSTWNNGKCEIYEPLRDTDNPKIEHQMFHMEQSLHNQSQAGHLQPVVIFQGILAGFVFIMLFDHYFWDIQQGQIMLWLILGIIAGYSYKTIDKL